LKETCRAITTAAASWSNPATNSYSIYSRIICLTPSKEKVNVYVNFGEKKKKDKGNLGTKVLKLK
jgi:hypothetical protein